MSFASSAARRANRDPSLRLALARQAASAAGPSRRSRESCRSSVCRRAVSDVRAMLDGSLDGDGGARYVDVSGLGASDFAGL